MNEMNKGDQFWKCPNCGRMIRDISFICATTNDLCVCGTQVYRFSWFILDKNDEIVPVDNKEAIGKRGVELIYSMGYKDGCAASAYGDDELDAAYRRGHNDGCVESAQLRAIEDTINTMCAGGESSTPATPDDIKKAYDGGYEIGYADARNGWRGCCEQR